MRGTQGPAHPRPGVKLVSWVQSRVQGIPRGPLSFPRRGCPWMPAALPTAAGPVPFGCPADVDICNFTYGPTVLPTPPSPLYRQRGRKAAHQPPPLSPKAPATLPGPPKSANIRKDLCPR